jgi:hypothetical protein
VKWLKGKGRIGFRIQAPGFSEGVSKGVLWTFGQDQGSPKESPKESFGPVDKEQGSESKGKRVKAKGKRKKGKGKRPKARDVEAHSRAPCRGVS